MPAKSRSQQRLFGMVHAYQKGEFHGPKSLRARISRLAGHISNEDARHFAETPHKGLPEKKAQVMLRPEQLQAFYAQLPSPAFNLPDEPQEHERSLLKTTLHGAGVGAGLGGLLVGSTAGILSAAAGRRLPADKRLSVLAAVLRGSLWGASRGAALGGAVGFGKGVYDKLKD